ncbi:hypothetical protein KY321_05150 [Candidatus Woesearchaeota archaeon]|nr:hypothetical protein [Candidatus Woesearchaeota archaeon]
MAESRKKLGSDMTTLRKYYLKMRYGLCKFFTKLQTGEDLSNSYNLLLSQGSLIDSELYFPSQKVTEDSLKELVRKEENIQEFLLELASDSSNFDMVIKHFPNNKLGLHHSYDFRKVNVDGKFDHLEGKLLLFSLEEYEKNDHDVLTPDYAVDLSKVESFYNITFPYLGQLVEDGFVRRTSYEDVFKREGHYDSCKDEFEKLELGDKSVYEVTPKGNGLITLIPESGSGSGKKQTDAKTELSSLGLGSLSFT